MELEIAMLSETSQTEEDKNDLFPRYVVSRYR